MKILRTVGWILVGLAAITALALVLGLFVQLLWNWLMPELFGLAEVTYWQAVGLLVLAHLLFKGHALRRPRERENHGDRGQQFARRVRHFVAQHHGAVPETGKAGDQG